ncbi:MAG: ATP-binding protein [Prevotella sp.]
MNQDEREMLLHKIAEANKKIQQLTKEKEIACQKLHEYEEMIKKAENASRMKSLFLANMSHEIRTPLNAIEGFSRIIAETESLEERMEFLEIIENNNTRLGDLINEILDFSRVEAGEISIKKTETDLNKLCRDIKKLFKFKCPEQIQLVSSEPTMSVTLITDPNRLTQVLSNLINNALKHTTQGSITYGYRLVNEGQEVEFHVTDTGTGIAEEDLDKIFQTYVSKDAETLNNGHGLGLPLSKIIVEKLGGKMSVLSTLGKGTTFRFTLPFEGSIGGKSQKATTTSGSRTLRVMAGNGNMKLILVAEDEDSNYELLKNVLSKRYRLIRARNGIEAVTMNEDEKPDIILMDIRMPEMNGLDATRIIKEINHDTPIIALSAYAFENNIREAKASGCDAFLAKPLRIEDLTDMIAQYLKE